ncbi:MAG: hypothetical protein KDA58_14095, partial [Planctomycetaceae bacterium]|nr:hypothetical protein [Planctomycetaceae bacterium]
MLLPSPDRTRVSLFVWIASLLTMLASTHAADPVPANVGQLGTAIESIPVPGEKEQFFKGQTTRDGKLYLTPNEAFFPTLGLTAKGSGNTVDVDQLNGGKAFLSIDGWNPGETAEWGILLKQPGQMQVRLMLSAKAACEFTLDVGEEKISVPVPQPVASPTVVLSKNITIRNPGPVRVALTC